MIASFLTGIIGFPLAKTRVFTGKEKCVCKQ